MRKEEGIAKFSGTRSESRTNLSVDEERGRVNCLFLLSTVTSFQCDDIVYELFRGLASWSLANTEW